MVSVAGPVVADGFIGPVFGLATAPNGDILAADAAVGISQFRDGEATLNAAFPGINDLGPIGRSSWWAVRGAADGQQGTDVGQGVYRVTRGSVRKLANLFEFEVANNPAPPAETPESNPFDVHSLDGEHALVVDAAGNDLLRVDDEGVVDVVAWFPAELVSTADLKALLGCPGSGAGPCFTPDLLPAQPVPTSVAVGPDGYYYVGELKGFPAPQNESRIWRVAPWASWAECGNDPDCELLFDGGFTSIIDMAFGPDGLLYVVELDENSWFAANLPPAALAGGTINACDVEAPACVEVAAGMPLPTAIAFGKDGTLWSTENGPVPGLATVVEVP
jgi:hypothetical protein